MIGYKSHDFNLCVTPYPCSNFDWMTGWMNQGQGLPPAQSLGRLNSHWKHWRSEILMEIFHSWTLRQSGIVWNHIISYHIISYHIYIDIYIYIYITHKYTFIYIYICIYGPSMRSWADIDVFFRTACAGMPWAPGFPETVLMTGQENRRNKGT